MFYNLFICKCCAVSTVALDKVNSAELDIGWMLVMEFC